VFLLGIRVITFKNLLVTNIIYLKLLIESSRVRIKLVVRVLNGLASSRIG